MFKSVFKTVSKPDLCQPNLCRSVLVKPILSVFSPARRLAGLGASFAVALALCAGLIASDAAAAPLKPIAPPAQSQLQEARSTILPRHCAYEAGPRRNPALVYSERCLRDSGLRARLPQHCARMLPTRGQRAERGYEVRCMAARGFVMAKPMRQHHQPRSMPPRPMPPRPMPPRY